MKSRTPTKRLKTVSIGFKLKLIDFVLFRLDIEIRSYDLAANRSLNMTPWLRIHLVRMFLTSVNVVHTFKQTITLEALSYIKRLPYLNAI